MTLNDICSRDGYEYISRTFKIDGKEFTLDCVLTDMDMWNDNNNWFNFGSDRWSSTNDRWANGTWNSFYGIQKQHKTFQKVFEEMDKIFDNFEKSDIELKSKEVKIGEIKKCQITFSYKYGQKNNFKKLFDMITKSITTSLNNAGISTSINTDDCEYDRTTNKVTGILKCEIDYNKLKVYYDFLEENQTIISIIHDYTYKERQINNVCFEKIVRNGEIIYDNKLDSYERNTDTGENIKTITTKESEKPLKKYSKVIDETRVRYRKRTFDIVKHIKSIDGIPVNCLIVRQSRGDKDRKKYTLNANDCELLGIEYNDGLEILPVDLGFENCYKKVKNYE